MNSRERFNLTMEHKQPDRPPIDIGSLGLTGMRSGCQQQLCNLLGFSDKLNPGNSGVDERILEWAGTDFRSVGDIIDLPSVHTQIISPDAHIDCWGIRREIINGEEQITHYPLKNASINDLKKYSWPEARVDEHLLDKLESEANALKKDNKFVIVAGHPVYGILELGCWMCGYDNFLLKMALDQDFCKLFFDKVIGIQLRVIEQYYSVLGSYIDVTTSGDDFGIQTGPFISPAMFQELIIPYLSIRIRKTKELGKCYYWHHSCGSVYKLIDQLIDCGVDILNPIQTSAAQMNPTGLKKEFGDKIVFWGAVDVQQFLTRATPEQVRLEVSQLIKILGRDGGYVIAPAHEMQDDIPPENIVAFVESIR